MNDHERGRVPTSTLLRTVYVDYYLSRILNRRLVIYDSNGVREERRRRSPIQ